MDDKTVKLYKIVQDEALLRDFIDWLPELKPNETYYLSLIARKKYCVNVPAVKSDKAQLKRFTSSKERMFEKIKQLEVQLGQYSQKGIAVPQEALALYITPNPRCFIKATKNSLKHFANLICDNTAPGYNPHQEVMSEIQKAKSYTKWIDFDIDVDESSELFRPFDRKTPADKYVDVLKSLSETVEKICGSRQTIIVTRGGFHILVDPSSVPQEKKNTFYKGMQDEVMCAGSLDISGDNLIPVVGCTQGGYTPYFLEK